MNAPINRTEAATLASSHPVVLGVDTLSVLHSNPNCPMAKTWQADGTIKSYSSAKYFELKETQINDIHSLSALLKQLEKNPSACIIRGKYVGNNLAKERTPALELQARKGIAP